ncbi:MAG: hypothetical protein DME75_00405 [Verrucomicrobia bacterium]|nr:MAG: hypothetical protein DME75_00405 [Verrucomicrobiota bacterium]
MGGRVFLFHRFRFFFAYSSDSIAVAGLQTNSLVADGRASARRTYENIQAAISNAPFRSPKRIERGSCLLKFDIRFQHTPRNGPSKAELNLFRYCRNGSFTFHRTHGTRAVACPTRPGQHGRLLKDVTNLPSPARN